MRWLIAIPRALLLTLATMAGAQITCPDYQFSSSCTPNEVRSVRADSIDCSAGGKYIRAGYDLRQGYFAFDEIGSGISLFDTDSMRIVGPPQGTPVTFRLHMRAQCAVDVNPTGPTAGFQMLVQNGFQATEGLEIEVDVNPGQPAVAFDIQLDQLVHEFAGHTFGLYTQWRGGGGTTSRVQMRATFEILDLPPDATLLSCRGFGDVPTTVRRSSWGALKQHYR